MPLRSCADGCCELVQSKLHVRAIQLTTSLLVRVPSQSLPPGCSVRLFATAQTAGNITNSMFATIFTCDDKYLRYSRGENNLTTWAQDATPRSGERMTNAFCETCGTLMWRKGDIMPGAKFMRVGTVDDISLHDTVLKPKKEIFAENRSARWHGVPGVDHFDGAAPS